jgi:hypothetical protein
MLGVGSLSCDGLGEDDVDRVMLVAESVAGQEPVPTRFQRILSFQHPRRQQRRGCAVRASPLSILHNGWRLIRRRYG